MMSTKYKQFKDASSDEDIDPPTYSSEKVVMLNQPVPAMMPMGKVIRPKAGWTICCGAFATCCCLTPLGLAGLIFAVMSTSHNDYEASKRQLKIARIFIWISIILGAVLAIVVITVYAWSFMKFVMPMIQDMQEQLQHEQVQAILQAQQNQAILQAQQNQAVANGANYVTEHAP